ncbi:MAG: hypothetical protein NZ811_00520 [Gammaproteobacteria bacterium]|nr:hypothetical protein [Gammaproteobacteria bacterium]
MGLVKNNLEANTIDRAHNRYSDSKYIEGVKVNMTLDILDGCIHHCPGCFVNRRGNSVSDEVLSKLSGIQDLFNNNGMRFSSFIIGPTDIFGSNNTKELLKNKYVIKAFGNCSTIEMVSTLDMGTLDHIKDVIRLFNKIPKQNQGFMYAMQVVVNPVEFVKSKIYRDSKYENVKEVLNMFDSPIDFKLVFNMDDKDVDFAEVSRIAKKDWDCLVEPIPSYQRSGKASTHKLVIDSWKENIEKAFSKDTKEYLGLTIADFNQGAGLELTYVLSKGEFYSPAFVYDVALIRSESFRIKDVSDIRSWTDIKTELYMKGMVYSNKTESCSDCDRLTTCLSKAVLNYMEHYNLTECVLPLNVLNKYSLHDIQAKDKQ